MPVSSYPISDHVSLTVRHFVRFAFIKRERERGREQAVERNEGKGEVTQGECWEWEMQCAFASISLRLRESRDSPAECRSQRAKRRALESVRGHVRDKNWVSRRASASRSCTASSKANNARLLRSRVSFQTGR